MSSNQTPGSAALAYPHRGLPVLACHWPTPAELPQFCSCGALDCPTPARHPLGTLTASDATRELGQLSRWWLAHPAANLATFTDAARVGVIELHHPELVHPANPDRVLRLLRVRGADPCPVIWAGPGRLQFLVQPGQLGADPAPVPAGPSDPFAAERSAVTPLASGTLLLLPPSRLMSGQRLGWKRRPCHASRLATATPLLEQLTDLIDTGALSDLQALLSK